MIRHIVFFTAKDSNDNDKIYQGLSLLSGISDCLHIEIAVNCRHDPVSQQTPTFIVYAEFESDQQLENFKNHPLYQQSIDIVRPLRDMRIAADFDTPQ